VFVDINGGVEGEEHKGVEEKKFSDCLEFEVYNQDMLKTELCNKWKEIVACPYSDRCQFAHDIGELRPVRFLIRLQLV
jgi:butyrate response factor 1